jgi:Mur ligase family, glutamate ligase domain
VPDIEFSKMAPQLLWTDRRWPMGSIWRAIEIMQASKIAARPVASLRGIGSLRGVHNAQNAACAAGAALALTPAPIQAGLNSFPGLAHRMEPIDRNGSVLFINDSKATNADSAARARLLFRHTLDRGRHAEDRRHRPARGIFFAHPQGLSDRRGGGPPSRHGSTSRFPRCPM